MGVARFEELVVWQKAKQLSASVYRATGSGVLSRDFGLKDQMQRAAVSVMSNVAEGFERNNRREFARFVTFARGSAGELRSQVYLAREIGYLTEPATTELLSMCSEVTRMLVSLRKTLEG